MAQSHYAQRPDEAPGSRPARRTSPTRNSHSAQQDLPCTVVVRGHWRSPAEAKPRTAQARDLVHPLPIAYGLKPGIVVVGLVLATTDVGHTTLELIQYARRNSVPVLVCADDQLWPLDTWRPTRTRTGIRLTPVRFGDADWRAQQHAAARTALGIDTTAEVA